MEAEITVYFSSKPKIRSRTGGFNFDRAAGENGLPIAGREDSRSARMLNIIKKAAVYLRKGVRLSFSGNQERGAAGELFNFKIFGAEIPVKPTLPGGKPQDTIIRIGYAFWVI